MPITGVPSGLRRQVKEAFVAALQTSPVLANKRAIKTWLVWDGKSPIADVTEDMCPACEVRMLGGSVGRKATARGPGQPMKWLNESKFTVLIDLHTKGTDAGDLCDLADLIYSALAPQDDDQRTNRNELFRRAGIKDCQLTREILPGSAESYTQDGISGQGSYTLTVQSFS